MDSAFEAGKKLMGGDYTQFTLAGKALLSRRGRVGREPHIGDKVYFYSQSLGEGSALQQSIGGIETLYKESSDTMVKYANEAYKTAGMSANDYMQTSTSFAAALLKGVGGDTAKAAEAANTAIIDMSDNANKMGTSMDSIQMAYQGFAKGNYNMLDNLKLGYGGTTLANSCYGYCQ